MSDPEDRPSHPDAAAQDIGDLRGLRAIEGALRRIGAWLGVARLSEVERRGLRGKWCQGLGPFATRAAACLEDPVLAPLLSPLGYGGAELRRRHGRYLLLLGARRLLRDLDERLGDTILAERAALHGMADGVLRLAQALRHSPMLGAHGPRLDEHVGLLRADRDRKNARISAIKRARHKALGAASPEEP